MSAVPPEEPVETSFKVDPQPWVVEAFLAQPGYPPRSQQAAGASQE